MVAVDEAHCISQWGQDFRPSYMDIRTFVEMLAERPVVSAFTATATERVRRDIESALGLIQPEVMVTGFDRPNLYFRVAQRKGGASTDNAVLNYLANHEGESGIIYCATKKNVDNLYELLLSRGIAAGRYHAGMSNEERKQSQEDFTFDRITVMVATNAFGMGIDKSNVRFVLHYNMPQSLENYYQEAGRAGRDGEYGECVLFYSKQDIMINKYLLNSITGTEMMTEEEIRTVRNNSFRKLNRMIDYCETDRCLRGMILEYFGEEAPVDCGNCSNCVPVDETEEVNLLGKKKKAGKSFLGGELTEVQRQLFEELREVRSVLAGREKVPPYLICGDKTLADMCVKLPEGETALLEVYGMGQKKVENYGEEFLDTIRNFRMFHEMTAEIPEADAAGLNETSSKEKAAPEKKEKKTKLPFHMTQEQWDAFPYKNGAMIVRDMANILNELKGDNGTAKISAIQINQILVDAGYLSNTEADGKSVKRVTEKGFACGMMEEERKDRQGHIFYALSHSRPAQEAIIQELRKVFEGEFVSKKELDE